MTDKIAVTHTSIANRPVVTITSPCIRVCTINYATGFCCGCWRNIQEIANWSAMSETARWDVYNLIEERKSHAVGQS